MNLSHLPPSAEGPNTRQPRLPWQRRSVVGTLAVATLAGFAAASFMPPGNAALPITQAMRAQINTMSTGEDQLLVDVGDTARGRNSKLPFTKMSGGMMSGFTEIAASAPGYDSALRCLTQAIYYEAANEPERGKKGVAQVVLNRLRHPAYPNSVCGVVYEGANARVCQFSFTCDGSLLRAPMARQWSESRRIAAQALAGGVAADVGSATHYHADYVLPRWAFTLGKLTQIGRHIFYRFPGRIGNAAAFSDRWTGVERIPSLDFSRLRLRLAAHEDVSPASDGYVPGLTVAPDVKDRHAPIDVGGRLDTTTQWRLSIPEPTQLSAQYRSSLAGQGDTIAQSPSNSAVKPAAAATGPEPRPE